MRTKVFNMPSTPCSGSGTSGLLQRRAKSSAFLRRTSIKAAYYRHNTLGDGTSLYYQGTMTRTRLGRLRPASLPLLTLLVALVLLFVGCSSPVTTWRVGEELPGRLLGTSWDLVELTVDGERFDPPPSARRVFVHFNEDVPETLFVGWLGCNGFGGFVTEEGLSLGAVTADECALLEFEQTLSPTYYRVDRMEVGDGHLAMSGEGVLITFREHR